VKKPTMKKTFEDRMRHMRELALQPLTKEEKERWASMFHQTWQAIGGDVEDAMRLQREKLTKAIICEVVCDCNYVQMYGHMTDEEYEFVCAIGDKPAFKRWLSKEMNY
jgi:hypothetical protein